MFKFNDAVVWIKNIFKITNVYECARPLLLVLGVFGVGATWIAKTEGVYALQNTRYSRLITVFLSVIYLPYLLHNCITGLFYDRPGMQMFQLIFLIIAHLFLFLFIFTINVGYPMLYVSCKRLDRVFQIVHNIDSQLEAVNIRVQHWHITLKLAVLALVTDNYNGRLHQLRRMIETGIILGDVVGMFCNILNLLFFLWVILLVLIIHERFVCLNKVLQQNATVTLVHIVGAQNRRDNYVLRRISLARHLHEQLSEAVQLFTDSCRYMVTGLLAAQTMQILFHLYLVFVGQNLMEAYAVIAESIKVVALISVCQANKNQRRVLNARLRHLCAFETNRDIIHQVQRYIMYNAYTVQGIIDLQFTDVDNVLLLTIIDVVISNALIIYSYTREGTAYINFD